MDSDVVWNYANFVDIATGNIVAPSQDIIWRHPDSFKGIFKCHKFKFIKLLFNF